MSDDNMKLWDAVSTTNPKYIKEANVRGHKIKAIAPQYQIKKATEQFGPYGSSWGLKDTRIGYELVDVGLLSYHATFFYPHGQFPIQSSISLYRDNKRTMVDHDFAKKVETDTLTKALSKIGFNADVFMGMYDDNKYVQMMYDQHSQKHTDDQEVRFYEILDGLKENPMDYVVFERMCGEEVMISLFNTFPPGHKTKYKEIARQLASDGWDMVNDYVATIKNMIGNSDPAVSQVTDELSQDEKRVIASKLTKKEIEYLKQAREGDNG